MYQTLKRMSLRGVLLVCALALPLILSGCPGPPNVNDNTRANANAGGNTPASNANTAGTTASTTKPCKGVVKKTVTDGETKLAKGPCTGDCADGTKCQWLKSTDQHGSTREWCACGDPAKPVEPADECYLVFYTPGPGVGGGPPEVICPPKDCPNGQKCQEQEKLVAETEGIKGYEVTCGCK